MINPKKLIKMARKWQKVAAIGRKRISLQRSNSNTDADSCNTNSLADKGHFFVYSSDQRRFVIPIVYLSNYILRELFKISEEEFGLPSDGPITLPCDAVFMEYAVSLIQQGVTRDTEKALLMSIATSRCSLSCSLHQEQTSQQLIVCDF